MTDTYERCSCGDCPFGTPRDRAKCSKESLSGCGKMCVKDYKEQYEAMDELTKQAQELNMGYGLTIMNADIAIEMLDNPKAPNDKLMELLVGK